MLCYCILYPIDIQIYFNILVVCVIFEISSSEFVYMMFFLELFLADYNVFSLVFVVVHLKNYGISNNVDENVI